MFGRLFPSWLGSSVPGIIVLLRTVFNVLMVAIVAKLVGLETVLTVAITTATLFLTVLMMSVLRLGVLGRRGSQVELLVQVILLFSVGYIVYLNASPTLVAITVVVFLCAIGLLLLTIPIYGEAFVAP